MKAPTILSEGVEASTQWDSAGLNFVATRKGNLCSLSITSGMTSRDITLGEFFTTIPDGFRPNVRFLTQDNAPSSDKIAIAVETDGRIQTQAFIASGRWVRIYALYFI